MKTDRVSKSFCPWTENGTAVFEVKAKRHLAALKILPV